MSAVKIYVEQCGTGSELVLLHGWGANLGVWQPVKQALSRHFRLILVDLPGHGQSQAADDFTLETVVDSLAAVLPQRAHILGWSLGGLVATMLVHRFPQHFASLSLVASTACFVKKTDWENAMDADTLVQFATLLQQDPAQTLQRFLALQVMGSDDRANTLRQLKQSIHAQGYAQSETLAQALTVLLQSDIRAELSALDLPVSLQFGRCDRIVPVQVKQAMQNLLPQAQSIEYPHAGHAPFISDADAFAKNLIAFIETSEHESKNKSH